MCCTVTQAKAETEFADYEFCDDYEPIDLCKIYFPAIVPPPELEEAWERRYAFYDSMHGVREQKIGNTWYTILTDCEGEETLLGKVKRLIFAEPYSRQEAFAG